MDPQEDGSCKGNDCFCPCDCNKYEVAFSDLPGKELERPEESDLRGSFEGSGDSFEGSLENSLEKAKSIDIKLAQTNDILNQIDLLNKNLFENNITTSQQNKNEFDKNGNRCYCHCKCCNKNEKLPRLDDVTR